MDLGEMQKLPHKWWKKGIDYLPCKRDVYADLVYKSLSIYPFFVFEVIKKLDELVLNGNIIPTKFDWYYAINTELLEFVEAEKTPEKYEEMADVAIFCTLCLKYEYDYSIHNIINDYHFVKKKEILWGPIMSWLPDEKQHIVNLLLWALSSPSIIKKIEYNRRRIDHGNFGR